jgi:hypothetical protein
MRPPRIGDFPTNDRPSLGARLTAVRYAAVTFGECRIQKVPVERGSIRTPGGCGGCRYRMLAEAVYFFRSAQMVESSSCRVAGL